MLAAHDVGVRLARSWAGLLLTLLVLSNACLSSGDWAPGAQFRPASSKALSALLLSDGEPMSLLFKEKILHLMVPLDRDRYAI